MQTDHFEWDDAKRDTVLANHRIDFWNACRVFDDPSVLIVAANDTWQQDRWWAIGMVGGRVMTVVHADGDEDRIRLITAWFSTKDECDAYAAQWPA